VPPATLPGAQIAYRLAQPTRLTVEIANAGGAIVRTLLKEQDRPAGYQVAQWDGKDEHGTLVPDRPYQARFSVAGKVVAEHPVTITPFVATIQTPADSSLVRGNAVPVIGEAYGAMFSSYVLEYGQGAQPVVWKIHHDLRRSGPPTEAPPVDRQPHRQPGRLERRDQRVRPLDRCGAERALHFALACPRQRWA